MPSFSDLLGLSRGGPQAPTTQQSLALSGTPDESRLISSPFGIPPQEAQRIARQVAEQHHRAKSMKRLRDLTAEKYIVHIDGEGQGQWADIIDGMAVGIPPHLVGKLMLQRNLLRPMVDNAVAYHTAITFRAVVRAPSDKRARDKARVDELHANHLIVTQRLNAMAASALHLGAAYGHGLLHTVWRDDIGSDLSDPIYNTNLPEGAREALQPGLVDVYLGDPWDTCYNEGATRWSLQWYTYGRVLPTQLVRQAFGHVPGVARLRGRADLASASRFQRTLRRWTPAGWVSSTAALDAGRGNEEMSALICKEILPGTTTEFGDQIAKDGGLIIVALQDASDTDSTSGRFVHGSAELLHIGPLPGRRPSATRFYMGQRMDDILGAPYVKDLDDLQVQLNHLVTLRTEYLKRMARPPLVGRLGSFEDDLNHTADDAMVLTNAEQLPSFLVPPAQGLQFFNQAIEETLSEMFRIGGWQAASRGESNPGDPAAKVVALARADDTVFGPINRQFQDSLCELLQTGHALAKQYMTVPIMAKLVGEEWGHLVDPWIRQEQMSDDLPVFQIVSGFGSTPESRAEQLMGLVALTDPLGTPLLTADNFWKLWPDHSLRPPETGAKRVRETRAQLINAAIEKRVADLRAQYPQPGMAEQWAVGLHQELGTQFPLLRTDDPTLHTEVLDQLVQDEYADPLVRQLARWRQDMYFAWQDMIAAQTQAFSAQGEAMKRPQQPAAGGAGKAAGPRTPSLSTGSATAGTTTSKAMSPQTLAPTVRALTNQARNA